MKIGDRVKFLTETGGGTVSGFRGKDTVLVEDEDGFEIPMLISDVVVEGDDSYDGGTWQARKDEVAGQSKAAAEPAPAPSRRDSGAERPAAAPVRPAKPEEKPVNPFPTERAGGEKLNILLAFLPEDSSNMTDTGFEVYLINDSNYFVTLQWLQASGSAWKARYGGTLEPNTLEYVETLQRADIGAIERTALQMIACKRTKPFDLKPAVSVEMRFDGSRLYKAGAFRANPFFEEPALIVEAGVCPFVDANGRFGEMLEKAGASVRFVRYPESRHGFTVRMNGDWREAQQTIIDAINAAAPVS